MLDIYTMPPRFRFFALLVTLIVSQHSFTQTLSNRGKEFWLGYGFNYSFLHEPPVNGQEMQVYISAIQAAQVTVSITNTAYNRTFSIPANTVDFSVFLPKSGADDARILREGLMNKAVCIKSDVPVAVYAHQYNTMVSGATMLIPKESYGYAYYSINYAQFKSGSAHPYDATVQMSNGDDWYSWFYVISSEDGTRIRITPSDTTQLGWLPGQTYTVDLKKGEIYNVMGKLGASSGANWRASKDLTGSRIVSATGSDGKCHPIAVFSGSGGIRLCRGDGGEYMGQQVLPARAWGTRYITYHMVNNTRTDILEPTLNFYRVCVQDPSTVVKRNGIPMSGLVKNFYYEFLSYSGDYIESDKPVLVSQYTPNANQCINANQFSYGDPEMIYLSPIEQGQKSILFYTPRKSYIDYVYGSIYLPTTALASLRVDGNPLPASNIIPHPTLPGYSVAVARFTGPAATHTMTSDSIFNAYIYGIGFFESYGFTAGTQVNDLNSYANIRNTLKTNTLPDTVTCPKTPFRAEVQVAYALSGIRWQLSQVPGLSPARDTSIPTPIPSAVTKIFGRTYYTYTLDVDLVLNAPGEYLIPYTYTAPDIDQCDMSESGNLRVLVRPGPRADFDSSGLFCLNDTISLKGASNPNGFNITRYQWDFSEGIPQSTADARKRFSKSGLQPVRYRIFADNGCAGDTTKHVNLIETVRTGFSISGRFCQDSLLTFRSTIGASNTGGVWCWDFGTGHTDSSRVDSVFRYAYASSGSNRTVRHWLVGPTGCPSDTSTGLIPAIFPTPSSPVIRILSDTLCQDATVRFDVVSASNTSNWLWDLGDGNIRTTPPPVSRIFGMAGDKTIRLRIWSMQGCGSPESTLMLRIASPPLADAGPDLFVLLGTSASLASPMMPSDGFQYLWQPAQGLDDPTRRNPVCTPAADLRFTLKVWDKLTHCSDTDTVDVFVRTKIKVPNTFTPNNDGVNDRWDIRFLDRYPGSKVEVYSTDGQPVWKSTGYTSSWDGKSNGRDLPAGTFYYVIDLSNGEAKLVGYVTILR